MKPLTCLRLGEHTHRDRHTQTIGSFSQPFPPLGLYGCWATLVGTGTLVPLHLA